MDVELVYLRTKMGQGASSSFFGFFLNSAVEGGDVRRFSLGGEPFARLLGVTNSTQFSVSSWFCGVVAVAQ